MLEEVIANWDRYGNTVASLQAWLEDAEKMLNQSEHAKKVMSLPTKETDNGEPSVGFKLTKRNESFTAQFSRECYIFASLTQES